MTETEQAILDTLLELDRAVATLRTAQPKPDLHAFFTRLDRLSDQLPPDAPGDLRHFLQRNSYEKAKLFLQGRGAENQAGTCGS